MKKPDGSYKQVNTNDPSYVNDMNRDVTPDKPMFQYGANDNYTKTDSEGNTVMRRQPDLGEKYLISEPDGMMRIAENTAQL